MPEENKEKQPVVKRSKKKGRRSYYSSAKERRKRAKRRREKLCTYCGKPVDRNGRLCSSCLAEAEDYNQKRRDLLKSLGLCIRCGKYEIFEHEKYCPECKAKMAEADSKRDKDTKNKNEKERRNRLKAKGICPDCGKNKPEPGYITCRDCLDKRKKRKLRKGKPNVRAEWDAELRCVQCGNPNRVPGKKVCEDCYRTRIDAIKKMNDKRSDDFNKVWKESNMRMRGRFRAKPQS